MSEQENKTEHVDTRKSFARFYDKSYKYLLLIPLILIILSLAYL